MYSMFYCEAKQHPGKDVSMKTPNTQQFINIPAQTFFRATKFEESKSKYLAHRWSHFRASLHTQVSCFSHEVQFICIICISNTRVNEFMQCKALNQWFCLNSSYKEQTQVIRKKVKGDIAYMYWNWIEVETKRKKTLSFPEATETNH